MNALIFCIPITIVMFCAPSVTTLECYICDSEIHGNACYDPMDRNIIKYQDCSTVYNRQASMPQTEVESFDNKQPEKMQNYNPMWQPNNPSYENPTDFACVQYEKVFYRSNRRQFIRKCEGRSQSQNLCSVLTDMGNFQGYSLTKCQVCYTDYCNSAYSMTLSTVVYSFPLCLILYQSIKRFL